MATFKAWTRIVDPDHEKAGPRKNWALNNMDPEYVYIL